MDQNSEENPIFFEEQSTEADTGRFLDSLGFGQTMLNQLDGKNGADQRPQSEQSEEPEDLALSSRPEDLDLPGAKETSPPSFQRGGLTGLKPRNQEKQISSDQEPPTSDVEEAQPTAEIEEVVVSEKEELPPEVDVVISKSSDFMAGSLSAASETQNVSKPSVEENSHSFGVTASDRTFVVTSNQSTEEKDDSPKPEVDPVSLDEEPATEEAISVDVEEEAAPIITPPPATAEEAKEPEKLDEINLVVESEANSEPETVNSGPIPSVSEVINVAPKPVEEIEPTIESEPVAEKQDVVEDQPEPVEEEAEPVAEDESAPITVECPACHEELTLMRVHLGVEGACVWCERPIVATQTGEGKVGVFLLASSAPEPTAQSEAGSESISEAKEEEPKAEEQSEEVIEAEIVQDKEEISDEEGKASMEVPLFQELENMSLESLENLTVQDFDEEPTIQSEIEMELPGQKKDEEDDADAGPVEMEIEAEIVVEEPESETKEEQAEDSVNESAFEPITVSPAESVDAPDSEDAEEPDKEGPKEDSSFKIPDALLGAAAAPVENGFANMPSASFAPFPSADAPTESGSSEEEKPKESSEQEPESLFPELDAGPADMASPFAPIEDPAGETATVLTPPPPKDDDPGSAEPSFFQPASDEFPASQESSFVPSEPESFAAPVTEPKNPFEIDSEPSAESDMSGNSFSAETPKDVEPEPAFSDNSLFSGPTTDDKEERSEPDPPLHAFAAAAAPANAFESEPANPFEPDSTESETAPPVGEEASGTEAESEVNDVTAGEPVESEGTSTEDEAKQAVQLPGAEGPLPTPAPAPPIKKADDGLRVPPKVKVTMIVLLGLIAGIGIASFFLPVEQYVEKAKLVMAEKFSKQIGLDPDWTKESKAKQAEPESENKQ